MIEITPDWLVKQGFSETFAIRFWSHVNKNGPWPAHNPKLGPCWVWTAYKRDFGYGKIFTGIQSRPILAHVASWMLAYGEVPNGLCICHKCDWPACVRPDHLFAGSNIDNVMDMISKKRAWFQNGGVIKGHKQFQNKGISLPFGTRALAP